MFGSVTRIRSGIQSRLPDAIRVDSPDLSALHQAVERMRADVSRANNRTELLVGAPAFLAAQLSTSSPSSVSDFRPSSDAVRPLAEIIDAARWRHLFGATLRRCCQNH